jgi:hypothetical protein
MATFLLWPIKSTFVQFVQVLAAANKHKNEKK